MNRAIAAALIGFGIGFAIFAVVWVSGPPWQILNFNNAATILAICVWGGAITGAIIGTADRST